MACRTWSTWSAIPASACLGRRRRRSTLPVVDARTAPVDAPEARGALVGAFVATCACRRWIGAGALHVHRRGGRRPRHAPRPPPRQARCQGASQARLTTGLSEGLSSWARSEISSEVPVAGAGWTSPPRPAGGATPSAAPAPRRSASAGRRSAAARSVIARRPGGRRGPSGGRSRPAGTRRRLARERGLDEGDDLVRGRRQARSIANKCSPGPPVRRLRIRAPHRPRATEIRPPALHRRRRPH
jgi:hypothetical protein